MCEAIRFLTERGTGALQAILNRQIRKIKGSVRAPLPELQKLGNRIDPERSETRARFHAPLLKELIQQSEMGGSDWRDRFASAFRMRDDLGEPGVYPPTSDFPGIPAGEERSESASTRFAAANKGQGLKAEELWREAVSRAKKAWLRGPHRYTPTGELRGNGELVIVNPAFRFGALQVAKLRAVDDLKMSSANEDALAKTPIKLPSRDHVAQM